MLKFKHIPTITLLISLFSGILFKLTLNEALVEQLPLSPHSIFIMQEFAIFLLTLAFVPLTFSDDESVAKALTSMTKPQADDIVEFRKMRYSHFSRIVLANIVALVTTIACW